MFQLKSSCRSSDLRLGNLFGHVVKRLETNNYNAGKQIITIHIVFQEVNANKCNNKLKTKPYLFSKPQNCLEKKSSESMKYIMRSDVLYNSLHILHKLVNVKALLLWEVCLSCFCFVIQFCFIQHLEYVLGNVK